MPVYDCAFPVQAEGLTVTVRDGAGDTVSSGLLTNTVVVSNMLVYRFTAAEGVYVGACSSPMLGEFEAQAVINIPASIAGGGVILDGDPIQFEINNGVTVAADGQGTLVWDTVPDGYEGSATNLDLPTGLYLATLYVEFDTPPQDTAISVDISGRGVASSGPFAVSVDTTGAPAVRASGSVIALMGEQPVAVALISDSLGAVSPDPLNLTYASITFIPVV